MTFDGSADVARASATLAARLPEPLGVFARLAYNYRWSWEPSGAALFRAFDEHRWELSGENPVRMLGEASVAACERAAADHELLARAQALEDRFQHEQPGARYMSDERPIGFFCTEFALHSSLPIYSGGLGVLAGDILKEASDMGLPYAGVGLLYRQGYFRQRLDPTGWQHEFWTEIDTERIPMALVTGEDGTPVTVTAPVRGRDVVVQIWRVNVGRVPLFLLDAQRRENSTIDRWITARLYVGDRRFRLAQYAVLGIAGVRALRAMGFDPAVIHMNEGHAALAPLELVREEVAQGRPFGEALEAARARTVFTTHTPIGAGNEAYTPAEIIEVLGDLPARLGVDQKDVLALGRAHPEDADEPFGMTPLGLRVSHTANGVSRRHGGVAREMWHHLYPDRAVDDVPIRYVTNGVHVPTWLAGPMREVLDRHLGEDWVRRASHPETWAGIEDVPDEELWGARAEMRERLIAFARERAVRDRLARGEPMEYVQAALHAFDPNVLTLGFARRATAYKRLYLLTFDPQRALRLLDSDPPVQLLLAGKPHPQDVEAKRILQGVFELKWAPHVSDRTAFLEDYDLAMAARLVSGCDVWINVPRPPLEACGTSGMKAAMNGVLNLSVLDGWWMEAYDGQNGWAITSNPQTSPDAEDAQDAAAMYELLEREVIPMFYQRGDDGIPHGWVRMMKNSLRTIGPRFCATRMVNEYVTSVY